MTGTGGGFEMRPPQKRLEQPRRVRHGIKFRRKQGLDGLPWHAAAFVAAVEEGIRPDAKVLAMEYALSGQVANYTVSPGVVEAAVQGRGVRPYQVRITCRPLSREEWDRVVERMAGEAVFAARLLTGDVPESIEACFEAIGRRLVPGPADPVHTQCDCGLEQPCKHAAAAAYLMAERIEVDPVVLFQLRGLEGERLLERLQEQRTLQTSGVSQAHATAAEDDDLAGLPPLEQCAADFWRPGTALDEGGAGDTAEHVPHALLRRMGPSPMGGKFPMVGLLASIYDSIRARAPR
ncbi:MAG: SWIM zinc finger family protein [Phycisphaerales bacterium]